jgi:mannosyltransferase
VGLDRLWAPERSIATPGIDPGGTRVRGSQIPGAGAHFPRAGGRYRQLRAASRRGAPALPVLIALAVTLWRIGVPSFWRDEAATLSATHRSLPDLFRLLANQDAVHGAYYLLMWGVVRLGGSGALAVRLPSAVAMAAAAGLVTMLGRRLVSARAGIAAGLVFAAMPPVSWFGQDARPFATETALACAASYLFVRVLDTSGRRRWLGGYGLALVLVGLANVFGLLLIAAHGLALAAARKDRDRRLVRGWLITVAAAGAAMLPFAVLDWTQRRQIQWLQAAGPPSPVSVERLLGSIPLAPVLLLITACAIAVSALRGRAGLRADWPLRLPALCLPWLLVPPAILLAVSQLQPVYTFRYIVFCVPATALLAGAALAAVGRAAACAALIVIVLLGLPAQLSERGPAGHGDEIRQLDQILSAQQRPGDVVLYPGDGGLRAFTAAYPHGLATLPDVALGRTPAQSRSIGGTNAPMARIRGRLTAARRVWVPEIPSGPAAPVPALTGLPFRLVRTWALGGNIWLALYARS